MKHVQLFEQFLNEDKIKVGDIVSRKFASEDLSTYTVISISNGKAKLKNDETGKEIGMYLSDLLKESKFIKQINEAAKWDVDVNEPYNDKDEKKFISSFKIKFDPITVANVEGQIDEDHTDLRIDFSNGDEIYLQMSFNGQPSCVITKASYPWGDNSKEDVTKYLERFMGSSGTVTGDLCILYKHYIEGKLK